MQLGDTTGLNILKASRNINRDIKFIIITGYSSVETAVESIRAGIYDYIIKPFDIAELRFRVKQAIAKLESDSALKHIEERYRIIMHHIPFGIAILSPEMEILEANEQVKEWFPAIINTETPYCYTIFRDPPGDGLCGDCIAKQIIVTGKSGNYIIPWTSNGNICSLKFTLNPVFDDCHKLVNILAVIEKTG
jgi:hypothetical protein